MPRRRTTKRSKALQRRRVVRRGRGHKGKGFMDFLKKANSWLRKTRAISKVGGVLGDIGVPYAGTISKGARAVGYGRNRTVRRRRRRVGRPCKGSGLRLAGAGGRCGGGLGLAGGRRTKKRSPLGIAY